jgi:predicted ferric reductase
MQVTNDKIGQLEATHATNTKLTGLETTVGNIDKSLTTLLRCFYEVHAETNQQRDEWEDEYIADTEQMNETLTIADSYILVVEVWVVFADVRYTTMRTLSEILNLRYLLLIVHMTLMHTLLGKLLLIKSLHAIIFLRMHLLGLLLVSSLIFLLFGG